MDKLIITILAALLFSCQADEKPKTYGDFVSGDYNLVFGASIRGVQYNLRNDSIKAALNGDAYYEDTLLISKQDKNTICAMFYEKKIYEYKNWVHVLGSYLYFPRRDDQIWIYQRNKIIATIEVSPDYVDSNLLPNTKERDIVAFRDKVWEIMNRYRKYQAVTDTLTEMRKRDSTIRI
ncbi:hypothetical protein [Dyadobacter sp. CY312]|uniref:hypothetical protein n=1 Tax=Dyadobacter sp. CY312 TaxID=2907303 RepID=UPI001F47BD1B|nr:hypothetical protein [Dyadobacter sp. CY312]MCE7043813.1 hypothetical protein [Dyadobacter sp. CY312]